MWAALSRRLADEKVERERLMGDIAERDLELVRTRAAQEAQRGLDESRSELTEQFKGIAAQITESNRETFLKELNQLTNRQTEAAEKNVKQLLDPVHADLRDLRKHVDRAENARESLASETQQLRQVLGDSRMRGAWGEQGLQRIVELAGLRERVDFVTQTAIGADSQLRPDMVVHLPDDVDVVIDAKAPLDAYKRAIETNDERERDEYLRQHAEALRGRAKELGDRNYANSLENAPEFVLMYVPTDPILDAAIDAREDIWEEAWTKHRVLITSPSLLIAVLKSVAFAWKRRDVEENAKQIAQLGQRLYERLGTHVSHLERVGTNLGRAVTAYNQSVGSLEGRVLVTAREFDKLGAVEAGTEMPDLEQLEAGVRPLTAPERRAIEDADEGETP
ncbi:DNA recombination protein RmuC [Candidatus Poriferisodalis sp.]|uniref:DNA recombination protein RmuC n=1 Tax=Candidatus Poriferisodalis sp. TaxID=3101277 RepID=UPI003B02633B